MQIIVANTHQNLMTLEGKVANVGPDHSMEAVIKTGEKVIIFYLKTEKQKIFSSK